MALDIIKQTIIGWSKKRFLPNALMVVEIKHTSLINVYYQYLGQSKTFVTRFVLSYFLGLSLYALYLMRLNLKENQLVWNSNILAK